MRAITVPAGTGQEGFRLSTAFELLCQQIASPITLVDVGGHGGVLDAWRAFGDKAHVFCFEARDEEASSLIEGNLESNVEYVSIGLSDDHAGLEINVAAAAGCSSAFPPIPQLYHRYPACSIMRPIDRVSCPTTTLDDFLAERGVEAVHGLKLDTQGFELKILQGSTAALRQCQFILVEVEFNALYEGQPLFCDVDRFLRDQGFVLWRLGNLAHYATEVIGTDPHHMLVGSDPGVQQYLPVSNGQLFWSDAFYVRREAVGTNDDTMGRDEAVVGAALAARHGFHDLALEMIRKSGDTNLLGTLRSALGLAFVGTAKEAYPAEDFLSPWLTALDGRMETDFSHADGHFVYGPYVRLPRGDYEVEFHIKASGLDQPLRSSLFFDVAAEMQTLYLAELVGADGRDRLASGRITIPFYNGQPNARFEFRVSKAGTPFDGSLMFEGVTLRQVPGSDRP